MTIIGRRGGVLLASVAMILAACSSGGGSASPAASTGASTEASAAASPAASGAASASASACVGPATITFLAPPWAVVDEASLKAWTNKTGITVQTISVPNEQVYQKVGLSLASQQSPADVIFTSEEGPSFIVSAGALEPLDAYIARDQAAVNPTDIARLDFWNRDGKQYGLTAYLQSILLDYNAKKFAAGGLTAMPKTWDEFLADAEKLKSSGADPKPIAFAGTSWAWYLMSLSMGDKLFDDQLQPTFNAAGSPARKAMAMFVKMYQDGLISPDQLTARDPHAVFGGGVGTLHQSWLGADAVWNNPATSKQAPDVKYMTIPEGNTTWAFDAAIGIGKYSKNKDCAWEFLKYYLDTANQNHLFNTFGLFPARTSVIKTLTDAGKIVQPEVQLSPKIVYLPRFEKYWGQWDSFVTETVRQALQGQITSDQAIDAIAAKWAELKG